MESLSLFFDCLDPPKKKRAICENTWEEQRKYPATTTSNVNPKLFQVLDTNFIDAPKAPKGFQHKTTIKGYDTFLGNLGYHITTESFQLLSY